jgi:hypothetical protein
MCLEKQLSIVLASVSDLCVLCNIFLHLRLAIFCATDHAWCGSIVILFWSISWNTNISYWKFAQQILWPFSMHEIVQHSDYQDVAPVNSLKMLQDKK